MSILSGPHWRPLGGIWSSLFGGVAGWLRRRDRGSPALEMGAIASLLLILLGGALEFGLVLFQLMQVDNGLEAGLRYASAHSFSGSNISLAVTGATAVPAAASPAPLQFCACADSAGLTCAGSTSPVTDHGIACSAQYPGNCGASCLSGFKAGTYVTVGAQYNLPPGFNRIPGFSGLLQAVGTVRVQ